MYNTDEEFAMKREIHGQEEKDEIQANENFNFPLIYLSDAEIIEFNEECKKSGIDLKVVPLSDYMNLSKEIIPNSTSDLSLFENSLTSKIKEIKEDTQEEEKFISLNLNRTNKSKENKENDGKIYINKKRKRNFNESQTEEIEKENEGYKPNESISGNVDNIKTESSISFNSNEIKKGKSRINAKKEKNLKKKKDCDEKNKKKKKNNNNVNAFFNNCLRKFKETSELQQNEEQRKKELIEEILEMSKYLTEDGLKEMASNKHIGLIGNQFKEWDLKKLNAKKLENLLCDIEMNTNFNKLEPDRKKDINTIKLKEELKKKSDDKALKKKIMKEEKKKIELLNNENNYLSQYIQKEIEEIESESSYDENDSLN